MIFAKCRFTPSSVFLRKGWILAPCKNPGTAQTNLVCHAKSACFVSRSRHKLSLQLCSVFASSGLFARAKGTVFCSYAYACCVNRKGVAPRFQDLRKCKPGSQCAGVCHARNLFALLELQLNQNGRVCRKLCVMTSTGLLVRSSRPLTVYYRLLRSEVTCGCCEKVAPSIRESGVHTRQDQCRKRVFEAVSLPLHMQDTDFDGLRL